MRGKEMKFDWIFIQKTGQEKIFVCGADIDKFLEMYQSKKLTFYDPLLHYYQAGPIFPGYYPQSDSSDPGSIEGRKNRPNVPWTLTYSQDS